MISVKPAIAALKTGSYSVRRQPAASYGVNGRFYAAGTQPAWAALTAVVKDQTRYNGAQLYMVTTAGTTAASGGPTGTGAAITDGSAVWKWLSAYGTETTFSIDACVFPLTGRELETLPEGLWTKELRGVASPTELRTEQNGVPPDVVSYGGEDWEVEKCEAWEFGSFWYAVISRRGRGT